ncbi:MAG: DUF1294 domain-containing protein [Lachnospiraceae bacterium]|nr:DUF1294 domain-containing protein [Lachnospiraceae bacterium]
MLTIIIYISAINIIGFAIMGIDKFLAKKKAYRIPEATLFTFALFGGSLGTTLAMFLFRHKTRHWYFLYGMPIILLLQVALIVFLSRSSIEFLFL